MIELRQATSVHKTCASLTHAHLGITGIPLPAAVSQRKCATLTVGEFHVGVDGTTGDAERCRKKAKRVLRSGDFRDRKELKIGGERMLYQRFVLTGRCSAENMVLSVDGAEEK